MKFKTKDDGVNLDMNIFLEERYIASTAYTANEPDEIGFQKGVVVDVLQKNVDGWWLIRYSVVSTLV